MSTKHPLVGKKLVPANPQRGEVTEEQIKSTLENAVIERMGSWGAFLAAGTNSRWTVYVGSNGLITDVTRT